MKTTVVILLSDKRSGSTMFEYELCRHPSISHIKYTPHSYNETHYWLMAACLLKMPAEQFSNGKRYSGYGPFSAVRIKLVDCIKGNVPDFVVPDDDEELVFQGWDALCRQYAKPVFFEKSPQHPHHWAALSLMLKWAQETIEFDVKFISLIRNPMAVMYSAHELFATDPAKRQFGWAHAYRNILAMRDKVGEDRFHMVKYEELIEQPKHTFGEVCTFLGLEVCDSVGEKVHSKSISKWYDDPYFTLQLDESVAVLANQFGYSEQDLYNPPKLGMPAYVKIIRRISGDFMLAKSKVYDRYLKTLLLRTTRRK